ncbi:MAG: hypothetical protein HQM10_20205 [Candidatus Riflebacteria bacterium]|nr:hypothetical protein [Candidatus Riflebacteria bacterium]
MERVKTGWFSTSKGDTKKITGCPGLQNFTNEYDGSKWVFQSNLDAARGLGAKEYSITSGGKKGGNSVTVHESVNDQDVTHTINQKDGSMTKGSWK